MLCSIVRDRQLLHLNLYIYIYIYTFISRTVCIFCTSSFRTLSTFSRSLDLINAIGMVLVFDGNIQGITPVATSHSHVMPCVP